VRDVARSKRHLNILNIRREEIQQKIAAIKTDRQGISIEAFNRCLSRQQERLQDLLFRISGLRSERSTLLDAARYRTGAVEIERLILTLKLRRDDFLASFDAPDARAARYQAHVERWWNAHGS
jgi:hypothetical protein